VHFFSARPTYPQISAFDPCPQQDCPGARAGLHCVMCC
jgi:hypothetical protein